MLIALFLKLLSGQFFENINLFLGYCAARQDNLLNPLISLVFYHSLLDILEFLK